MNVTTTTLQMRQPPEAAPRALPAGARLERAVGITPEYARFLYGLVGGPRNWTDRLEWTRDQWARELAVPGTEFWVLYGEGVPWGFVQLQPLPAADGTHVEIRYFGLAEQAIGRGLGGLLLEHGVEAAWSLTARQSLPQGGSLPQDGWVPEATRVWVHTCSLDGPAALANYQARGFVISLTEDAEQAVPERPLGSWASTGGPV